MKPANILRLYRVRLRARFLRECFAIVGIATGVALLFASQVSSSSLQSSVGELSRGIAGRATLQLVARDSHGFSASTLEEVRRIPGVRAAAPLLESPANAIGPRGSESVELVGADASLSMLGGALVRHTTLTPFGNIGAVVLPAPLASAIGVSRFGQEVTFQLAGRTAQAPLYSLLHAGQIGALTASPVALVPLRFAQEMTGLDARVTRILVQPAAGSQAGVRASLQSVAAGRLNVEAVGYEGALFAKAAAASNQSTALFAAIGALIGFLFAFNAMLLTVPERRRLVVDLRRDGYGPRTTISVLLLDALALGLLGCVLGLVLGEELSIRLLHSNPAFLSLAFTVGTERAVGWQSVAFAIGGGMLAALVAVLSPLHDILRPGSLARDSLARAGPRKEPDGARAEIARRAARTLARPLAGIACLAGATLILLAAPDAAIPGMALLMGALLLVLPLVLSAAIALTGRLARGFTSAIPHLAAMELGAARTRAVAIAATGAVAVFGGVTIAGAHGDLLEGLENAAGEMNASTDVWVSPAGSYNLLNTTSFAPAQRAELERLPGVRAVGLYRGGLLDYGERRVLVLAPPPADTRLLSGGQLVQGDARRTIERVGAGGWLVVSKAIADEHHLHIGQSFTLPSPDPRSFRIAAFSTNLGWAPGAIVMNGADYARAWGSGDVSAYSILLAPGIAPARGAREVEAELGSPTRTGLAVQTAGRHDARQRALSRRALARLTQIAALILAASVLAMAAAIGALIWQRRPRLAKLKLEGFSRAALWRTILLEGLLLLGVGCLTGAIFGLYGQQLADRALANTIGFPVVHSVTALSALGSLVLVVATALAILALPGYLAASVPARLALED